MHQVSLTYWIRFWHHSVLNWLGGLKPSNKNVLSTNHPNVETRYMCEAISGVDPISKPKIFKSIWCCSSTNPGIPEKNGETMEEILHQLDLFHPKYILSYIPIVGYKPMIFVNVGKTRINPCGNGLYQLFISIYGDFGDGLWPCFAHIGSKIPVLFPLGFPESAGTARLAQAWSKM